MDYMDLSSKRTIKALLESHKATPLRALGQNFLIDKKTLEKIIKAANIEKNEEILEIGPGLGVLTVELAKRAKSVIAVEKDKKMAEILKEATKDFKNVKIVQKDILKTAYSELPISDYKIVANLPYCITSPAIRKFLEIEKPPKEMVLMVQKEVAERICSKPPQMSLLAVSVQFYAKPEIAGFVSRKAFWPAPNVDSAIIKIIPYTPPPDYNFQKMFFKVTKAGFSQPRKQLLNNLATKLKKEKSEIKIWLLKNRIEPTRRAETLTVEDWTKLAKNFVI